MLFDQGTKTHARLLELFRQVNLDVKTFNELGEKSFDELFTEWEEREVDLLVIPEKDGVPAHLARVALQAAILLVVPSTHMQYLEIKRVLRSGRVIEKVRNWTITETCRRGTCVSDEAMRAVKDELGFTVSPGELRHVDQTVPKPYQSSVFYGITTYSLIHRFALKLGTRPWDDDIKIVQDTSKQIHVQALPMTHHLWCF